MTKKQVQVYFVLTEETIPVWQGIVRKLLDMPRVGFNKPFNNDECTLIDELADLSGVDKGKEVTIKAGNTIQGSNTDCYDKRN